MPAGRTTVWAFKPGYTLPSLGPQITTPKADIVLTIAPRVRLFSADVFGPQGTCEVEVVIHALRWAIDVWKCKIINLSLGAAPRLRGPLEPLLVGSLVVALIALFAWFFLLAENPPLVPL